LSITDANIIDFLHYSNKLPFEDMHVLLKVKTP